MRSIKTTRKYFWASIFGPILKENSVLANFFTRLQKSSNMNDSLIAYMRTDFHILWTTRLQYLWGFKEPPFFNDLQELLCFTLLSFSYEDKWAMNALVIKNLHTKHERILNFLKCTSILVYLLQVQNHKNLQLAQCLKNMPPKVRF